MMVSRPAEPVAEIGFWLAPRYRCRGLATAAMNMVCEFGFRTDTLALHRIEWRAFVGNHASTSSDEMFGTLVLL